MDSALVYRGLDIGTAKPAPAIRSAVPHHLIDILEPTESYSAGRFARDAAALIGEIRARGRLPLLVGGTLLYLRALRDGLSALPRADRAVRAELDREAAEHGWAALHERLRAVDPAAAERIAPSDRQRIQRALEVHALTQPADHRAAASRATTASAPAFSRSRSCPRAEQTWPCESSGASTRWSRQASWRRSSGCARAAISTPTCRRCAPSAIARSGPTSTATAPCEAARAKAIVATRQYAKRQLTWLRGDPRIEAWPALAAGLVDRCVERLSKENLIAKNGRRLC